MKRILLRSAAVIAAAFTILALSLTGCTSSRQGDQTVQPSNQSDQKSDKAAQYTCPMHPEVVQDKPGDCPKCGMKLVEKR